MDCLIRILFLPILVPCNSLIAISPSSFEVISTKPKPLDIWVYLSITTLHDLISPIFLKMKEEVNYNSLKLVIHPGDEYNYDPINKTGKTKNIRKYFVKKDWR